MGAMMILLRKVMSLVNEKDWNNVGFWMVMFHLINLAILKGYLLNKKGIKSDAFLSGFFL